MPWVQREAKGITDRGLLLWGCKEFCEPRGEAEKAEKNPESRQHSGLHRVPLQKGKINLVATWQVAWTGGKTKNEGGRKGADSYGSECSLKCAEGSGQGGVGVGGRMGVTQPDMHSRPTKT